MKVLIFSIIFILCICPRVIAQDDGWRELSSKVELEQSDVDFTIKIPDNFENFSQEHHKMVGTVFLIRHNEIPDGSKSITTLNISVEDNPYIGWKKLKEENGVQGRLAPSDFFKEIAETEVGMEQLGYRIFSYKRNPALEMETKTYKPEFHLMYLHQSLRLIMYGDYMINLVCADFAEKEENLQHEERNTTICEPFFNSLTFNK
ncbi:MAG: hypothetical protein LBE38_06510 [Deltaproteobacteria bacterium]|jgi:hypothetical protein|nr:hypothetical protein [Deltaproteobacteria bacterium]